MPADPEGPTTAVPVAWVRDAGEFELFDDALFVRTSEGRVLRAVVGDGGLLGEPQSPVGELRARAMRRDGPRLCVIDARGALVCARLKPARRDEPVALVGDGAVRARERFEDVAGVDGAVQLLATARGPCAVTRRRELRCWGAGWAGRFPAGEVVHTVARGVTAASAHGLGVMLQREGGDVAWHLDDDEVSWSGFGAGARLLGADGRDTCVLTADGRLGCWTPSNDGSADPDPEFRPTLVWVRDLPRVVDAEAYGTGHLLTRHADRRLRRVAWDDERARFVARPMEAPDGVEALVPSRWSGEALSLPCVRGSAGVSCWDPSIERFVAQPSSIESLSARRNYEGGAWLSEGRVEGDHGRPAVRDEADVVSVLGADAFACVMRADGRVRCAGSNQYGDLGIAGPPGGALQPVRVVN